MKTNEDRFMFHAGAVPFGVQFSTPPAAETRAATALPSIGGRATASAAGYLLDGGFVRFEAAGSEVVGDELSTEDDPVRVFRTRATSWIRRLRIAGLLEIGELSVTLESRYEMRDREPAHEPSFLGLSIKREGLTVCGKAWKAAESADLKWINRRPTYEAAKKDRRTDKDIISVFGLRPPVLKRGQAIENPRSGRREKPQSCGPAAGGLMLEWPDKDETDTKPSVRFYFGEYVVSKGYRRFTAVRMVITRSPRSQLVIGEVSLNGSKVP